MDAGARARMGHRPGTARQDHHVAAAVPAPARRRRLGPDLCHRHAAGRGRGRRRAPHADRQPGRERRRPRGHPAAAGRPCGPACGVPGRFDRAAGADRRLVEAQPRQRALRGDARDRHRRRTHRLPHARRSGRRGQRGAWQQRREAGRHRELRRPECHRVHRAGHRLRQGADGPDRSRGPPLRHAPALRDRRGAGLGRRLGHLRPRGRAPEARAGCAGARPAALGLLRHARPWLLQAHGECGG
ncbi:hypothetical protein D3C85_895470 [compost metagenome]